MATLDDLIAELHLQPSGSPEPQTAVSRHHFDDMDDEAPLCQGAAAEGPSTYRGTAAKEMQVPAVDGAKYTHDFDVDSDEDAAGSRGAHLFPVPFPSAVPRSETTQRCCNGCTVTNVGFSRTPAAYPTLEALGALGRGQFGTVTSSAEVMKGKGAYHAYLPQVGNGCRDDGNDPQELGGCPHITCLKCRYTVVRLQGAAWNDQDGQLDLYLTVRNFYPDWSRLAVSSPVGLQGGEKVLRAAPSAAAYCCQCSWLTVESPKERIRTAVVDVIPFKDKGGNCFATRLPTSDTRRPPLWTCAGHLAP